LGVSEKTLKTGLLEWSFCDDQWLKLQHWDLKQEKGDETYDCIIKRNIQIIEHWQTELRIAELIPQSTSLSPFTILNAQYWEEVKGEKHPARVLYDPGDQEYYTTKEPILAGSTLHFYVIVPDWDVGMLQTDKFQLGIVDMSDEGFFGQIKLPDADRWHYETDKHRWLWNNFNLMSIDQRSIRSLVNAIENWLSASPQKDIKALATAWRKVVVNN